MEKGHHATAQQRQIKGLLNRLSDMNFYSIVTSVEELHSQHRDQKFVQDISEQIIQSLIETPNVLDGFILQYSTLVTAFSSLDNMGANFSAHFVATLMNSFISLSETRTISVTFAKMLAFLYTLQLIPESFVVEVSTSLLSPTPFVSDMSDEIKIEVLLALIKSWF